MTVNSSERTLTSDAEAHASLDALRGAFSQGYALDAAGKQIEAAHAYQHAVESFETLLGQHTQQADTTAPVHFARLAAEHAVELSKLNRSAQALAAIRRATEIYEELILSGAGAKLIIEYCWALAWKSALELLIGNLPQALTTIAQEIELRNSLQLIYPHNPEFEELLNWAIERQGQLKKLHCTRAVH